MERPDLGTLACVNRECPLFSSIWPRQPGDPQAIWARWNPSLALPQVW